MHEFQNAFISRQFLRSHWALDFDAFRDSPQETALLDRLKRWAKRTDLKETSAVPAFLDEFFRQTWGYLQSGQAGAENSFSLYPEFAVRGYAGHGSADAALGWFGVRRRGGRKRALGMRAPMALPQAMNQRWSLDFVSDALACGRRFRVLAVVDDFTRECLALVADTSLSGLRVGRELDRLVALRGRPAMSSVITAPS